MGWGIVAPTAPGRCEEHTVLEAGGRTLESRRILEACQPSWAVERPIKDLDADWPAYERTALVPSQELDWRPVEVPSRNHLEKGADV